MTPLGTRHYGWFKEQIILLIERSLNKDASTSTDSPSGRRSLQPHWQQNYNLSLLCFPISSRSPFRSFRRNPCPLEPLSTNVHSLCVTA